MKNYNFYKLFFCFCTLAFLNSSVLKANNDYTYSDANNISEMTTCNGTQIAYWSLDACESFSSNGTNLDYSEFTPSINTPTGFSTVNASGLTHEGGHSCTEGQSGYAICSSIRNNCSWQDNSNAAFRFSVTVNPANNNDASLTKLSFYEAAPHTYSHISGNTGDNDPPSHYGIRVLKNGQEIYQSTGKNTTENWSLEQFDFTGDADFTVSSQTTFEFELLGYCRQGSNGLAVWDLDEIKVFGCAESNDPCAGQGGDSDGDGVCDAQDCQPNNNAFPATPGMSCNDGNSNTENDVVSADGCGCSGTPIAPSCNVTTGNCSITITGLNASDYTKVFNSNWQIVWECNPWISGGCNNTEVITNLNNGNYFVQACGQTQSVTVTGCATDPCAGQGGDSDGDGVCDAQDCQPNNSAFPATPGMACNDGNPNTENDIVTADGCGCAGTPVGPACGVTTGNCSITITGLNNSDYAKVFNSNWQIVWECNPWANGGCNNTEVISNLSNGNYHVQACGQTQSVTVTGCTTDPCAGQGGDSDGDGVCDAQDCQPNNSAFPATPGMACNDGNANTENDVVTADGCGCAGTPVGPACGVTTGNCSITITGLNSSDYAKVFNSNWQIVWECNPWANGGCNNTEVISNLSNGNYHVQACGQTQSVTVTGCTTDPCAGQGGDSDGDGVCDAQDCQPNNSAFPATPGMACNDGNPNTENDVVTADGCGCAGTPVGPACGVTTGNCSITITGLNNSDYAKVFNTSWQIVWECNPWANGGCNNTEVISNLSNGTYFVQACGQTQTVTVTGCTTDPCAGQGGDSDGDGVCDAQDCQPNNSTFPATPGMACNDGNPNTENDVITADGCGCAGTPVGPACGVTTGNCSITITGLNSSDYAKVFNTSWQIVWECNPWSNGGCNATETITDLQNGTYYVQACGGVETVNVGGCVVDPCAGQGGDSDGDGVCDAQDCQPNNNAFPATPGTPCNDGNVNTENDVVTADGCGCTGTPVQVCNPSRLAYWSLDDCESFSSNGSNLDFSEFTSNTNSPAGFSVVNASILTHDDGAHSCTEGQSGLAICSGIRQSCSWSDNSNDAFKFSITVRPSAGGTATLTSLKFFEAAPHTYSHISGNTGDNDPPSKYGIRVLKNGQEIYQKTGRNTTENWSQEHFNLGSDPDFVFTGETTFEFELLGYCRQGTGGLAVWDLDEIEVFGCAGDGYVPLSSEDNEALFFQAQKDNRDVALNWVSNTDFKTAYFEVEHSMDGLSFETIEEVVRLSESAEYMSYQNRDENAEVGINYYRLKQVFLDGSFRYSQIREVAFDLDVNKFTIYPNPTSADVFVNLKDFVGNAGTIRIHNALGQTVYTQVVDVIEAAPIRISTSGMTSGVHAVTVQINDKKMMTELLMIAKQ